MIVVGAGIAAAGLRAFLLPNELVDGGVVGIAIIVAELSRLPLSLFLVVLNLPFVYLGYRKIGRQFAVSSLIGISLLALATALLQLPVSMTNDPILAAGFGGLFIGAGVGLVLRAGGTLDGTEVAAILGDRRSPFSVGEIIMFFNIFILGAAGFIFGWENAMYSLIAYFVAYKTIDVTVAGLDGSRSVWIVSNYHHAIASAVKRELGRDITRFAKSRSAGSGEGDVLFVVITRLEERRLKALVHRYDPGAFIAIGHVHEVWGHGVPRAKHHVG